MADTPLLAPLPADLPEDWNAGQIVSPAGTDVGLTKQHGYNYLMEQVNAAQRGLNIVSEAVANVLNNGSIPKDVLENLVTALGGGELFLNGAFGGPPYQITFTEESDSGDAFSELDERYALKHNTVIYESLSLGRVDGSTVGSDSVTLGRRNTAEGIISFAQGGDNQAKHGYSFVIGDNNISGGLGDFVLGNFNNPSLESRLTIGNGSPGARANSFRIDKTGSIYSNGILNSSGADYAEMFEWSDGNPSREDRRGLFVTLQNGKIRPANQSDQFIVGVVSGNPSVVGDVHDDQWHGMYEYDIFGTPLWEEVKVPDRKDEDGNVLIPAHTERRQKINPAYDSTKEYTGRTKRPEWAAVGMVGKLVAVDDGSCQTDGWCMVSAGGIATASQERTRYYVMGRLDENHVKILIV